MSKVEEWQEGLLKDLSVGRLSNGAFNDPKLVGKGYRLINVVDIYEPVQINVDSLRRLDASCKDFDKFRVECGDLFFTRSSLKLEGIAHCARYRSECTDVMWECHIMRCKPNKNLMDSDYLYEFCHSYNARKHFMKYAKTGTMTTIDQAGIGCLSVPVPPLPEQRKIAKIFAAWDKAIATTEKLISASKQQKKSLMQQLLTGRVRLCSPTGEPFSGTWEEVRLGELSTKVGSGVTPKGGSATYKDFGTPLIRSQNVLWGKLDLSDVVYIDEANVNQHVCIIRCEQSLVPSYLKYYLLSFEGQKQIEQCQAGGNRQGLNFNQIKSFKVLVPSFAEQKKIAQVFTTADKEIETLETKLAHLQQEKKALMQQLLTGKRRVKVDEVVQ